jgi:ATP-dependent DNA helicase RecG
MENEEPIGSKEYEGPVWKMIEDVYIDVVKEIGKTDVIISTKRKKFEWYPTRAIREAIINAVAHRNYLIHADIRIFIYPNKIVIRSPGGLVPGVDLNDPEHVPRNPSLCNLLYDTGFIERYGYGIKMIRNEVDKHPGLTLNFNISSHRFEMTIKKDLETLLSETDLRILNILVEPMKSGEISKKIGKTKPTTIQHLKKMEQLDLVKKIGTGPQTRYRLK